MKRQKKFEAATAEAAAAMKAYQEQEWNEMQLMQEQEREIEMVKQRYAQRLTDAAISKAAHRTALEQYTRQWAAELFKGSARSAQVGSGTVGMRQSKPRLALMEGSTWDSVFDRVRLMMPDYIRVSEEVAKDRLLADRTRDGHLVRLESVGLKVEQTETFYIK